MSEEIKHYGVKGMKWGVRREQAATKAQAARDSGNERKAAKLDKQANKKAGRTERMWDKSNASAEARRKRIEKGERKVLDVVREYGSSSAMTIAKNKGNLSKISASNDKRARDYAGRVANGEKRLRDRLNNQAMNDMLGNNIGGLLEVGGKAAKRAILKPKK